VSALDFERERGTTTNWFGMPTNAVKAVLEAYTFTGVLGLARRDGNRRYYDLLERLLPAKVLAREVPLGEQSTYVSSTGPKFRFPADFVHTRPNSASWSACSTSWG
jgi:uncharacterized protein YcaQ